MTYSQNRDTIKKQSAVSYRWLAYSCKGVAMAPIESFGEVEQYFRDNADSEDVKKFTGQFKQALDRDNVAAFFETEDGRKYRQSMLDQNAEKAVLTWKERHFAEELDRELLKRNPPKTEAEKRLAELEKKFADAEAEKSRGQILNETVKFFAEHEALKGFGDKAPLLAELALSSSEELTKERAGKMVNAIIDIASEMRASDIATRARKPEGTSSAANGNIDAQMEALRAKVHAGDHDALHELNILRLQKKRNEGV